MTATGNYLRGAVTKAMPIRPRASRRVGNINQSVMSRQMTNPLLTSLLLHNILMCTGHK